MDGRSTLTNFESGSNLPLNELLDAMSDIFISYSKADHALALKLSAFLEAEGWSVWWDKSLAAADLYRDEIMKQLAAARAVITIWTENSVKSDWVRAEAGRAKAEGKLIPVKTADVAYADIPLPFGEMHTENVGSTDLIRAAVVAQITKPVVQQSPFSQITSTFKYNVLTWVGIVGSGITLFANVNGVLNLADWARELAVHWHDLTQMFWGWAFSLIKVEVPREVVPLISFSVFSAMLVIGVNLSSRASRTIDTSTDKAQVRRKVITLVAGVLLYFGMLFLVLVLVGLTIGLGGVDVNADPIEDEIRKVWLILFPPGYLLIVSKERLWVSLNSLLFYFISLCLLLIPMDKMRFADWTISEGWYVNYFGQHLLQSLFPICWMAVILFSPIKQLTRRLGFVVLGVLMLIALSEISKLNLHHYLQPPQVSDNSVR